MQPDSKFPTAIPCVITMKNGREIINELYIGRLTLKLETDLLKGRISFVLHSQSITYNDLGNTQHD